MVPPAKHMSWNPFRTTLLLPPSLRSLMCRWPMHALPRSLVLTIEQPLPTSWNIVRAWEMAELLSRTLESGLCFMATLLLLRRQCELDIVFSAETRSVALLVRCTTAPRLLPARGWLLAEAIGIATVGRLTTAALFVSGTGLATVATSFLFSVTGWHRGWYGYELHIANGTHCLPPLTTDMNLLPGSTLLQSC